jgi:hypothetical protein
MSFQTADELAKELVAKTTEVWRQTGDLPEPTEKAWRRIFGRPISMFVMAQVVEFPDGSYLVVRLHPEGRIVVVDPLLGASIRVLPARARELIGNIGGALAGNAPLAAYYQSHGVATETVDGSTHFAKMGGATFNFLNTQ